MHYEDYINQYKADRKEAILLQAAQMFLQQGIEPVKMTDIASQCEIGVASLYRYFGTKASIVIAAGCLLWKDLKKLFEGVFESDAFRGKNGKEQIRDLMRHVTVLFVSHKEFLRFVTEFDTFVLANQTPADELKEYEASILDFYPVFEKSWEKGCQDGSIRKGLNSSEFYFSVLHALMSMCQKFLKGEILDSDDFSGAERELQLIIEMSIYYIAA